MKEDLEERFRFIKMFYKKGVSGVVAALLLVLLTIVLVGVVWGVIDNLVKDELEGASCVDTLDKVTLNSRYTCYKATSNEFQFSITRKDVEIDGVVVAISANARTESFTLETDLKTIDHLREYEDPTYTNPENIPEINEGKTYVYNMTEAGFSEIPDSVEIAPKIGKRQCDNIDRIDDITFCT